MKLAIATSLVSIITISGCATLPPTSTSSKLPEFSKSFKPSMSNCEKVEIIVHDTFEHTFKKYFIDAMKGKVSEEGGLALELLENYKEGFSSQGFSDLYHTVNSIGLLNNEAFNIKMVASFSKAICITPSLAFTDQYERKLSYCNSAANRSGSDDESVQRKATYDCILESLNL